MLHISCSSIPLARTMVRDMLTGAATPFACKQRVWLCQTTIIFCVHSQLQIAVSSGFRNSGLSISKNQRIILVCKFFIAVHYHHMGVDILRHHPTEGKAQVAALLINCKGLIQNATTSQVS